MTKKLIDEATVKLALKALETAWYHVGTFYPTEEAIELYDDAKAALKALAEQPAQQEPVAWVLRREDDDGFEPVMFYGGKQKPEGEFKDRFVLRPVCFVNTTPQPAQRTWVGLTDDKADELVQRFARYELLRAIETELREKNNG